MKKIKTFNETSIKKNKIGHLFRSVWLRQHNRKKLLLMLLFVFFLSRNNKEKDIVFSNKTNENICNQYLIVFQRASFLKPFVFFYFIRVTQEITIENRYVFTQKKEFPISSVSVHFSTINICCCFLIPNENSYKNSLPQKQIFFTSMRTWFLDVMNKVVPFSNTLFCFKYLNNKIIMIFIFICMHMYV